MSTQLPPWVYDMVMDLQYWEDTHPDLYVRVGEGWGKAEHCGCHPLGWAPLEVQAQARAIKSYLATKGKSEVTK